ncbi:MAG TPA: hypothetical protein VGE30_02000 [Candidatus Saccharimonadales bacterium]
MKLLPKMMPQSREQRRAQVHRRVLREQAKMGGTLFGPVPKGHRREFFCLDRHTWVWHEEWIDQTGKSHAVTTRYDVRPQGVLKSQGNSSYQLVEGAELRNLHQAAKLYYQKLSADFAPLQQ